MDKPLVAESHVIKTLPANTTLLLNAAGSGNASANLPHGTAPTTPTDGDFWSTTTGFYACVNGVTVGPFGSGGGTPGGSSGQIQYNNAGSFGGFTAGGDATINTATGAVAVTKTGGVAFGYFATGTDAANLTGNLSVSRFNSGTGASSSSFWRGDGTWAAAGLSAIADGNLLANTSGSSAVPVATPFASVTGVGSALKWTTARTITLGTDLSGSVSLDGSANVTLNATIANNAVTLAKLATQANQTILANISGATAVPSASGLSAVIDNIVGSTQGSVLYRGASAWSALGPGSSGQVLQTNGGGVNPSWVTPTGGSVGSGGLALLEQHTASSSAALTFTASISATYDEYVIEVVDLVPNTNGASLGMQMSTNGGSSYDSSAIYNWSGFQISDSFSGGISTTTGTYFEIDQNISTTSGNAVAATIRLYNPGGGLWKRAIWEATTMKGDGHSFRDFRGGRYINTTAVNAFQFIMSSGNIASGTVRVYGLVK